MPDYIYLLENRLSAAQRNALKQLRDVARDAGHILFLTGDAVRDLTSGHAVRDIEVSVHGNALKLKKAVEKAGAKIWGEDEASHSLYLSFPGSVRIDLTSTHKTEYPKPGKPVFHWTSIQEDLRRRDFTANAMAISLNEGSYGLLMDPLNGAADIESRTLRLVSNYGFLEEPAILIRAARLRVRLGWELDPRTQSRYENAKEEKIIEHLSAHERSKELEQIAHEDDGLKVLAALEAEGWMQVLFPAWTVAKADEAKLKALHDLSAELQIQGVHPNMSAAQMELLTAKLQPKDLAALKKELLRPGFVEEWNSLDAIASGFSKVLLAKPPLAPSATFKLFTSYDPKAVLWLGFTSNSAPVKERYEQFLKVWPEARQRIPYALMQEMRITQDLPIYQEVIEKIFLELIDGRLTTPEETKAFLEPFSPPPPPPTPTTKRPRGRRAEPKVKERSFDDEDEEEGGSDEESDLEDIAGDEEEEEIAIPKMDLESDLGDDEEGEEAEEEDGDDDDDEPTPKRGRKGAEASKPVKTASAKTAPAKAEKTPAKPAPPAKPISPAKAAPPVKPAAPPEKAVARPAAKPAPPLAVKAKAEPAPVAKKAAPAPAPKAKPAPPVKKAVAKAPAKPAPKAKPKPAPAKAAVKKPAPKPAKAAKPVAKKPAPKPAKKR